MKLDIVRFWKDASYRNNLSTEEQVLLPSSPVGAIELVDEDLASIAAAAGGGDSGTVNCCEETVSDIDYCCVCY